MLQILCEERVDDEHVHEYFEDLYKVVCVGARPGSHDQPGEAIRTTYVVDWEHLVHVLEDYSLFGDDIVEVRRMGIDEAQIMRAHVGGSGRLARA